MPTFKLNLICEDCRAVIKFDNEVPEWKDERLEIEQKINEAKEFVAKHPTVDPNDEEFFLNKPELVAVNWITRKTFVLENEFDFESDMRYVDCPACGGKARIGSGWCEPTEGFGYGGRDS